MTIWGGRTEQLDIITGIHYSAASLALRVIFSFSYCGIYSVLSRSHSITHSIVSHICCMYKEHLRYQLTTWTAKFRPRPGTCPCGYGTRPNCRGQLGPEMHTVTSANNSNKPAFKRRLCEFVRYDEVHSQLVRHANHTGCRPTCNKYATIITLRAS